MRKSKLICELIFIFLLPLVFLSFNISINQEYVYDDYGNFKTSGLNLEINNINFINDVSEVNVIGYDYVYYEWEEFVDLITSHDDSLSFYIDFNRYNFENVYYIINVYNHSPNVVLPLFYILDNLSGYEFIYGITWVEDDTASYYTLLMEPRLTTFNLEHYYLDEVFDSFYLINDNHDLPYFEFLDSGYLSDFDFSWEDFGSYSDCPFVKTLIPIEVNKYKNPIYEVCVQLDDYIGFDSTSTTMQIINAYTTLWVLMFFIWHLLYMFLDFFPHLFERKRE